MHCRQGFGAAPGDPSRTATGGEANCSGGGKVWVEVTFGVRPTSPTQSGNGGACANPAEFGCGEWRLFSAVK